MKNQIEGFYPSTFIFYLILFYFILFLTNCGKEKNDPCIGNFSQEAMFENMSDRVILPAYLDLQNKINSLRQKATIFEETPDESNLSAMQAAFAAAWISWQAATPFEFGPAETVALKTSLSSFPSDITLIEQNIANGNYNLNDDANTFAKGFSSLDYLLYGLENDEETLVETLSQTAYTLYLFDVIADIKLRVDIVLEEWEDKDYRSNFIKNTGTRSGGSLSLLIEGFYKNYTCVKDEKLGIPSGISTASNIHPEKVEALYSGLSLDLMSAAIIAMEKTFKGGTGDGLDDYLVSRKAKQENKALNLVIEDALDEILSAIQKINGPFAQALQQDFPDIEQAYSELQKLDTNLKEEMPTALCINL